MNRYNTYMCIYILCQKYESHVYIYRNNGDIKGEKKSRRSSVSNQTHMKAICLIKQYKKIIKETLKKW